jgi:hypothetical protein
MQPHPRIRKTIKWGGAAVTVLLVVVWIASGWAAVGWYGESGFGVRIGEGGLQVGRYPTVWPGGASLPQGLTWDRSESAAFSPGFMSDGISAHAFVPLWIMFAIVLAPTVFAWRLDARARPRARLNLCQKCAYDRAGLASPAKCPECGAPPATLP